MEFGKRWRCLTASATNQQRTSQCYIKAALIDLSQQNGTHPNPNPPTTHLNAPPGVPPLATSFSQLPQAGPNTVTGS